MGRSRISSRRESEFSLNIGLCVSNADCLISRLSILIILILTVRSAKFLNFREDDFWRQVFTFSQQAFDPCQYRHRIRAFRRKKVLVKVKVMRMSSNAFMMGRVIHRISVRGSTIQWKEYFPCLAFTNSLM